MPKTKLQVPFPEPKNLVDYGTLEGKTEERCQGDVDDDPEDNDEADTIFWTS